MLLIMQYAVNLVGSDRCFYFKVLLNGEPWETSMWTSDLFLTLKQYQLFGWLEISY